MKWGKWIGGGIGWALGGPIGALIGFALGAVFDTVSLSVVTNNQPMPTQSGDFIASLLVLTAAVMKADGRVVKSELDFVKRVFVQQFGAEAAREQMLMLRDILGQEIPLREVCEQIGNYMDYSSRLQLIHFLFGISASDGQFHAEEVKVIGNIAAFTGISTADFESIRAMFVKDSSSAYKILEISPDASDEDVKKAYRNMAVKYHPDKVSHLGPEMQKSANEKFQQLNAAYEQIKKERGIK